MKREIDEPRLRRLEANATVDPSVNPDFPTVMPNIIEFAISKQYLDQKLYPRQATLLKLVFCSPELLTDYDMGVLQEWISGFTDEHHDDGTRGYAGTCGVVPDVLDRIEACRGNGRGWFREVIAVAGRRGSKGFLGAIATAYVLWNAMATHNPQSHFGIPSGKQLHVLVFAGQQNQAQVNQWRDLAEVLKGSQCFPPYIAATSRDTLRLYSPAQVQDGGLETSDAAFVISAKESTSLAGRGPASIAQLYDEMAHMDSGSTNRPADEIYSAASPGTAQFGGYSFLYQASSPWQMTGKFYHQYRRGLSLEPQTGAALDPDMLVLQLPSTELYRDWQLTHGDGLAAWPGGPRLTPLKGAIFDAEDEDRHRRADPLGFDVEFGAQWAATQAAYLPREDVDRLFATYRGKALQMRNWGTNEYSYVAHADPSTTGANFALVVAHLEADDLAERHAVIDLIRVWRPQDFPGHRINYVEISSWLKELLCQFRLSDLTFDQYNSAGLLDELKAYANSENRVLGHPRIHQRTATAPYNQRVAENLKAALARGLVHAPQHDLAAEELRFLEVRNGKVDHPTSGPVQTSDIADCMMSVVDLLLGDGNGLRQQEVLGRLGVSGSPGINPLAQQFAQVHAPARPGSPRPTYRDGMRSSSPSRGRRR